MKKSIVLAALLTLFTQFTFATDGTLTTPAQPAPKIKLTFEIMDGSTQISAFKITANSNPSHPSLPIQIRSGYDIPYTDQITEQESSKGYTEVKRFKYAFNGIDLLVTPSITTDQKIQLVITGHKSDVKRIITYTVGKNPIQGPSKAVFVLAQKVLLENNQQISLQFGEGTLNIHAKFEEAGGASE